MVIFAQLDGATKKRQINSAYSSGDGQVNLELTIEISPPIKIGVSLVRDNSIYEMSLNHTLF